MGWYGVDFDGTLAMYDGDVFHPYPAPIPAMVKIVREWLANGVEVRIMTARASAVEMDSVSEQDYKRLIAPVDNFCQKHFGQVLPITYKKDFQMVELWDDRAIQVIPNKGERADKRNPMDHLTIASKLYMEKKIDLQEFKDIIGLDEVVWNKLIEEMETTNGQEESHSSG